MNKGNPDPSPATRFQPGQSGNPLGGPKWSVRQAMRDELAAVLGVKADGTPDELGTLTRRAGKQAIAAGLSGDLNGLNAIRGVIAEVEGPHTQEIHAQVETTARVLINGFDMDEPEVAP